MLKRSFYRFLITLTVISLTYTSSYSQFYYYNDQFYDRDLLWEAGVSIGTMNGLADVGRKKFSVFLPSNVSWKTTKMSNGIYGGLIYKSIVAARLELTAGRISAYDENGRYKSRRLSYKTNIHEIALVGEFHPLPLLLTEELPAISPYFIAGFGGFSFKPKTLYDGGWVDAHPLHTEGQGFKEYPTRKDYKMGSYCGLIGGGLKYEASARFNVRLETVLRYTGTDYLDDASTTSIDPALFYNYLPGDRAPIAAAVSNPSGTGTIVRGGTKTKDNYLTVSLKVAYVFGRERIIWGPPQ